MPLPTSSAICTWGVPSVLYSSGPAQIIGSVYLPFMGALAVTKKIEISNVAQLQLKLGKPKNPNYRNQNTRFRLADRGWLLLEREKFKAEKQLVEMWASAWFTAYTMIPFIGTLIGFTARPNVNHDTQKYDRIIQAINTHLNKLS